MKDLFKQKKNTVKVKNRGVNEIKQLINRLETLLNKLNENSTEVETQEFEDLSDLKPIIVDAEERIEEEEIERFHLPKQAIKHKKEIIKQEILLQISTTNIALKELKREFVDRRKYCSKASFYRYVKELKIEQKIGKIVINSEEFVYLSINK